MNTLDKERAKTMAQALLDGEFDSFEREPVKYGKAMGWSGSSLNKCKRAARNIAFTNKDVDNLTSLIQSINLDGEDSTEQTLEICENGSVQDFLTNCVAGYIQDYGKSKKINNTLKRKESQIEAEYRESGYVSHRDQTCVESLAEVNAKWGCEVCKVKALRYIGLRPANGGTHVAICICDNCGEENEF